MVMIVRKKFRGRRKAKSSKIIKILLLLFIIFILYKFFSAKFNFKIDDIFLKYIINDYNNASNDNILYKLINKNTHNLINNPSRLLATNFYSINKEEKEKESIVYNEQDNSPIIYLYNSHQSEGYSMEYMEDYNVNPTVQMTANIMKERFDKMGLYTIVEDNDISAYLKENDMKYYQSYEASRHFLVDVIEKYDSIKLYIDIHRDAVSHEISSTNINGVDCAKIMFVVGKEYDSYLSNLENTNYLNNMIKEKYPALTRGVLQKEGKNVNGIYNQDLGSNIMLIEVGGNYNNIVEVMNTLDIITPIIGDYINEKR